MLTYVRRLISTFGCFLNHFCWLVNCMNWVYKLYNNIHMCGLLVSSFIENLIPTIHYFFWLFHPLSKLLKFDVWIIHHILGMFRHVNSVYVTGYLVLPHIETLISIVSHISATSCGSVNCITLAFESCSIFQILQKLEHHLQFRLFSIVLYENFSSNYCMLFQLQRSVNCTGLVYKLNIIFGTSGIYQ